MPIRSLPLIPRRTVSNNVDRHGGEKKTFTAPYMILPSVTYGRSTGLIYDIVTSETPLTSTLRAQRLSTSEAKTKEIGAH